MKFSSFLFFLFYLVCVFIFKESFAQEDNETAIELLGRSSCTLLHDQDSCIAKSKCGWCVKQDYHEENRCDTYHRLKVTGCEKEIFEPKHEAKIEPNKTVDPILVHILPGMTRNITVSFSLSAHPLDLYYLMDFSGSMSGDKNNLITLASKLITSIANITEDYRLGLGSFVDKPITPFGSASDYVFKNRLPLTTDTSNFANIVRSTNIMSGADSYEGTAEAMLQAVVCKENIGWRDNSRRILLVATDDGFHIAGDGKNAKPNPITKPNDGLCHLDSAGDYTAALIQDYPSIEQLKNVIESNSITTIFAVRNSILPFYQNLTKNIKASTVAVLDADSTNVVELINREYEKIHSRVELQNTNPTTSELRVRYFSNCHDQEEKETHLCEKLPKNGIIKFIVSIDLKDCPKDPKDWNQKITVSPIGLPIHLDIEANLVCGSGF